MTERVVLSDTVYDIDTEAHDLASVYGQQSRQLQERVKKLLVGRKCIVRSKFNNQPYGRSKKPLTGQIRTIEMAHISDCNDRISILLNDCRCFMDLNEVELLKERA